MAALIVRSKYAKGNKCLVKSRILLKKRFKKMYITFYEQFVQIDHLQSIQNANTSIKFLVKEFL